MGDQSRTCPEPVSGGLVGTGWGIPAESAGKKMKPPVEDPAVSGKMDRGTSPDWVSSSEGGVWSQVVGHESEQRPGLDSGNGP